MNKLAFLCILLIVAMWLSGDGVQPEGSGTEDDPYLVTVLDNLLWISTNEESWDNWFEQTEDIDASETENWNGGTGFSPIGWWESVVEGEPFEGSYKGNYHVLSNLYINRAGEDAIGFFGFADGAELREIVMEGAEVAGDDYVACLTGLNLGCNIENCHIRGNSSGDWGVALLCGNCNGWRINCCYVSGNATGTDYVGGVAGLNYGNSDIFCSASSGIMTGEEKVGGLIGYNYSSDVWNCYSTAEVSGEIYAGGLAGESLEAWIANCYATGSVSGEEYTGGLIGYNNSLIHYSIWNTDTSGQEYGLGYNEEGMIIELLGKTSAEMQSESCYLDLGWDFVEEEENGTDDYWTMEAVMNNGFAFIHELSWAVADSVIYAFFRADKTEIAIQEPVNFINLASGAITEWEWDFDNNGLIDSSLPEPVWVYPQAGTYWVSLTVSDAEGNSHTLVRADYITVESYGIEPAGSGSEQDPYQIASLANLAWLSYQPAAMSSYFLQTSDINASESRSWSGGLGFAPIGNFENQHFRGSYDGAGHVIDSLYINRPLATTAALFGDMRGGEVSSLGLTNLQISGGWIVGGLAGFCDENSSLTDCYITGQINGANLRGAMVGLLSDAEISNCFYDRGEFMVGGEMMISVGALRSDLFEAWLANDLSLEIDNYLMEENGSYLISYFADLEEMTAFCQDGEYAFRLTGNLDLAAHPGFYIPYFEGEFDGNGFAIENLLIDLPEAGVTGLFGLVRNSVITELKVINIEINSYIRAGGLAGVVYDSQLTDCYCEGYINCYHSSGILCGVVYNDSQIFRCSSSGSIYSYFNAGGLAGIVQMGVSIAESNSNVIVDAVASCSGGLVSEAEECWITDCYATGEVSADDNTGGLIGIAIHSEISRCYASGEVTAAYTAGGLMAVSSSSAVNNSVWNIEISGQEDGIGWDEGSTNFLLGCTTEEMQQLNTYTDLGWDFVGESVNGTEDIWDMDIAINSGFPFIDGLEWADIEEDEIAPHAGDLLVYPNPFNPQVTISFLTTEGTENTEINIYNIKGQSVKSFKIQHSKLKIQKVVWDAGDNSSGVYLMRIKGEGWEEKRKITLLK